MDFEVVRYRIITEKLRGSYTMVLLSDLHHAEYGTNNKDLLHAVKAAGPDRILCPGDMVTSRDAPHAGTIAFMKALCGIAPVLFANGNHETMFRLHAPEAYDRFEAELTSAGVVFLNNRSLADHIGNETIDVYGFEAEPDTYRKFTRPQLSLDALTSSIGKKAKEHFTILLAHNPTFAKTYAQWGADLTVAGHYHGGAIRTPGNRALMSPYGFPLPKYGYGTFNINGSALIVTSGLGDHAIPLRIHNPKEIAVISIN